MNETYLFFDIECANCFDGVGKMCSFGYVLTDSLFNIIESDDIVMNPECEFDWFLFSKKTGAKLAYPKEYFRKQPPFPVFYAKIRELLTCPNRKNFIFGSISDVGFVVTAVERYHKESFDFAAADLEKIIKEEDKIFGRLENRCEIFNIDNSDITPHNSRDDALMTMRLLKAYCEQTGKTVEELTNQSDEHIYTTAHFIKVREIRLKKKMRKEQNKRRLSAKSNPPADKRTNHTPKES